MQKIAPLSDTIRNEHHARETTHGNVLKESDFFPGYNLVHFFYIKKYFYCSDKVIKLECPGSSSSHIGSSVATSSSSTTKANKDFHSLPKENSYYHILFHILNNKIFQNPGHEKSTVPDIDKLFFEQYFPWMTKHCVYKFIQKHRPIYS